VSAEIQHGAEGSLLEGGPSGVLMLHGFTANPSGLRPFAEHLHARGHTVSVPRLPGHGTSWEDLEGTTRRDWEAEAQAALTQIAARTERVTIVGLSFGAALGLHLAARRPSDVHALVLVNPYVLDRRLAASRVVKYVRRTVTGVGDDIRKEGATERPYERVPVRAIPHLASVLAEARADLPSVRQPLLLVRSAEDHTIPRGSVDLILRKVGSRERRSIVLGNSYHVAWLDHDAEELFERTHAFIEETAG